MLVRARLRARWESHWEWPRLLRREQRPAPLGCVLAREVARTLDLFCLVRPYLLVAREGQKVGADTRVIELPTRLLVPFPHKMLGTTATIWARDAQVLEHHGRRGRLYFLRGKMAV